MKRTTVSGRGAYVSSMGNLSVVIESRRRLYECESGAMDLTSAVLETQRLLLGAWSGFCPTCAVTEFRKNSASSAADLCRCGPTVAAIVSVPILCGLDTNIERHCTWHRRFSENGLVVW
jgi:hypothetical protein